MLRGRRGRRCKDMRDDGSGSYPGTQVPSADALPAVTMDEEKAAAAAKEASGKGKKRAAAGGGKGAAKKGKK